MGELLPLEVSEDFLAYCVPDSAGPFGVRAGSPPHAPRGVLDPALPAAACAVEDSYEPGADSQYSLVQFISTQTEARTEVTWAAPREVHSDILSTNLLPSTSQMEITR